ncbi:MAG: phospho-N-acetylmuramoyl-pentapeptide-transferase [Bacteroidales bacterium]|nr:phospho-N-acetylmuramoyl-pentapeptide-transferase [Bacteroidales bacterium]
MLYYIFRYLNDAFDVPGAGMWGYISTRSIAALILSLIISTWFGNWFINYMKRNKRVEVQRDAATDPFNTNKVGVPTMGGVIIIVATIIPSLLFGRLRNIYMLMMLFSLTWLGLLGFLDDYLKARTKIYDRLPSCLKRISEFYGTSETYRQKNKNGLRPLFKLLGQFMLGLGVGLVLWLSPDAVVHEGGELIKSTLTTLPFVKDHNLDYAGFFGFLGSWQQAAGWAFFVLVATFIVMAVSNGSNLNDGLDGMCAGNSALMLLAFGALAYFSSHAVWAHYFNIMFIPGSQELVVFISAFVGALVGFLWFNTYPAQIFMGDTGSLAIGGTIGVIAMIIHKELLIPIICFVFLAESISVMLQTSYAKRGNKKGLKLRMFMRTPIHDSFRITPNLAESMTQQGINISKIPFNWIRGCMHENRITVRFWIVTLLMASFAIMTLKIR